MPELLQTTHVNQASGYKVTSGVPSGLFASDIYPVLALWIENTRGRSGEGCWGNGGSPQEGLGDGQEVPV